MNWEQTTVRKPRGPVGRSLGQDAFKPNGKARPIERAKIEVFARQAQHARCVEHVAVPGLVHPVCITRGADRERLIAEARELAGAG